MKKTNIDIRLKFVEPLLGSACNNPEVHEEFIASKAPTLENTREEVEAIDTEEEIQKAMTVFPKDEKGLFIWDYQIRGFIKEAIGALIELGDIKSLTKWGYKRAVDSFVFVTPRRIYLFDQDGKPILEPTVKPLSRPLRATTMKGDRVALATSEQLPAGTQLSFSIMLLEGDNPKSKSATLKEENIVAALEYGALKGLGQWRSGGFGRFEFEIAK